MLNELKQKLDAGDLEGALAFCHAQIENTPDSPDAHRHLAQLLAATKNFPAAHRSGRRACELTPDDPRCWSDLGRIYAMEGEFRDAATCFQEALRVDPRHADAWHNLGTALKQLGDRPNAFTALKNALMINPERADTYLNLSTLLINAGQLEDALECLERAAKFDPTMAQARSRLAQHFSQAGKVKRAESLFRQSLALDPDHITGWFGLGRTLEDLGEAEGALGCYLQVLARRPGHAQAMGQYLALVKGDAEPAVLQQAVQAMDDFNTNDEAKALVGYGLLKYHDRRKDYAAAAQTGLAANAARRRKAGPLDRDALTQRVDSIIATYHHDFFHERRRFGMGTDQPVFIVGLPRSGTTLTEQILSSHPQLHGAGELPDLSRIALRSIGDNDSPWQAATRLGQMQSHERAADYLKALRDGVPKGTLRISDKSPLIFFHLAFAALLFPNARVVHCIRDARDNALSIWMENFNADQRYATDFEDLAFYRTQYKRLMAHWREHLPLPILDLHYEDTVADLEGQARRLIDFLGAPWDAACLDFHKSERAVQTPSRWQVRQPVYSRSVARWRAYESYLPDLVAGDHV